MRKAILVLGGSCLLSGTIGCSHTLHEAKAEYHQNRADAAAAHRRYYKAAAEQRKADIERWKAAESPLP